MTGGTDAKLALYFGCRGRNEAGHYLQSQDGRTIWDPATVQPRLPWGEGHMDSGLLKNGNRPDVADGRVFWTLGGRDIACLWHAFFWWDNSGDKRGGSNSGLYVYGFAHKQDREAFAFGCAAFPMVMERQRHPLVLQAPTAEPPQ